MLRAGIYHHPLHAFINAISARVAAVCLSIYQKTEPVKGLLNTGKEIEVIICGHAHTHSTRKYNDCIIDVCPATCFQWQLGTATVQTENKRGYKLLDFHDEYHSETFFV